MYLKVRNIKKIILYIIAVVVTVMALYPLLWMIAYSLRLNTEIFKVPPSLIPDKIILSNYVTMVTGGEFGIFFGNSIFISLIATALVIIVSSLSAYGLSRFEFRGKRVFSFSILSSQLFPVIVLLVPLFVLFNFINLYDSRSVLILTYTAINIPFAVFLLVGFFNKIPKEIEEAANIDGASKIQVFIRIVLPIASPGLVAVAVYAFISAWEEFLLALSLTVSVNKRTLPIGLMYFFGEHGTNYAGLMAASCLASFPTIILFLFLQKYFVKGLTEGAVKG